ncbi:up-regulator of cell proliferation-like, partial [Trematomus bernacchii]|uniref:up-regulator of cell proliferation-like n=1 Tax=Trematomus bernacchii TaxID=40690 RepID=UPI00146EFCE3
MDNPDVEEHYGVSDSFPDPCCEDGKNTPAAPESEQPSTPVQNKVDQVSGESESLHSDTPAGEVESNNATCGSEVETLKEKPDGALSKPTETSAPKESSTPVQNKVDQVSRESESLHSDTPAGEVESNNATCGSEVETLKEKHDGALSKPTETSAPKEPSTPVQNKVDQVSRESESLHSDPPAGEVESNNATCGSEVETLKEKPDGALSKPTETSAPKEKHLESLLEELGLDHHIEEKLSISTLLRIDKKTITDKPAKCNSDLPWYFLKKLMMVNVTARNVKCIPAHESNCEDHTDDLDDLDESTHSGDTLNPLDIVTALFLCSDGFVQQEMALKMSMCQFSVPLLLPNCDTKQCTLMLWAMRDIVKKYRPQSLSESRGFIEERIVVSELPMISFVRLGECSLSKSEILNKLLSNSQQYHDTFVHHNMEGGDSPRRISNGLVEMTWYLPCGNKNMDVFSEPVAVANLRGDIASSQTQFDFLCQTSAAVFVFFDALDSECELLTNQNHKAQIFLVGNRQSKDFKLDAVKKVATKLSLKKINILLKEKHINDANFVKDLRGKVSNVIEKSKMKMGIEKMADVAHELGICVDEDSPECQTAKENADAITAEIQDLLKYKEAQLPLQGQIWKDLTRLEKEELRLKDVGSEDLEKYKSDLQLQKKRLREKQNSHDISKAMTCFIYAISSLGIEKKEKEEEKKEEEEKEEE